MLEELKFPRATSALVSSLGGAHFGILTIARILAAVVGAAVLASGLPILRSYALLAVCPAVLCLCAIGIHRVVSARPL